MRVKQLLVFAVVSFLVAATGAVAQERIGYTTDFVTNWFPTVEPVLLNVESQTAVFGQVPDDGIHPCIFFNEEDRSRFLDQITKYEQAANLIKRLRELADFSTYGAGNTSWRCDQEKADRLVYAGFLAWLDDDAAAREKAVSMLLKQVTLLEQHLDHKPLKRDVSQRLGPLMGQGCLPFLYDLLFNDLSVEQQQRVRGLLQRCSNEKWVPGMDAVAAHGSFSELPKGLGQLLMVVWAVEGDAGSDDSIAPRAIAAWKRFLINGIFEESGAPADGRSLLHAWQLAAMARRGQPLIDTAAARRYINRYRLFSIQAFGENFISSGGQVDSVSSRDPGDAAVMTVAFPGDQANRTVYIHCKTLKPDWLEHPESPFAVLLAVFAENGHVPSSVEAPFDYLCKDSNFTVLRSGWQRSSAYMHFAPRSDGGQAVPSHGAFVFSSHGVEWAPPPRESVAHSKQCSLVVVDEYSQGPFPGRIVGWSSSEECSCCTSDLLYPYGNSAPKLSANSLRLEPGPYPWQGLYGGLPHWYHGSTPRDRPLVTAPYGWKSPIKYAWRSVAMRRGKHPYALIVDDIDFDDKERSYAWRMLLPEGMDKCLIYKDAFVLQHPKDDKKCLMIRLLDASGKPELTLEKAPSGDQVLAQIRMRGTEAHFKVLLYPFTFGELLPGRLWKNEDAELHVLMPHGKDVFDLSRDQNGPCQIKFIECRTGKDRSL